MSEALARTYARFVAGLGYSQLPTLRWRTS